MRICSLVTNALLVSQVSSFGTKTIPITVTSSSTISRSITMIATTRDFSNDCIIPTRNKKICYDTAATSIPSIGSIDTCRSTRNTIRRSPKSRTTQLTTKLNPCKASLRGAGLIIKQKWWCFPMILISIIPLLSLILVGEFAKMPEWWALKDISHLRDMPLLCSGFLGSNIFYFLSGLYLLNIIPTNLNINRSDNTLFRKKVVSQSFHTARHPMLGGLLLTSGFISLLYHTFQSFGKIGIAESLCFVDHGVAFSSFCYFLNTCGLPSFKTLAIGIPSLALLAFPGDAYPVMHSLWHMTSAGATISWAFDGVAKRRKFISSSLQEERKRYQLSMYQS